MIIREVISDIDATTSTHKKKIRMRLYAHNLLACLKCQAFPLDIGPNAEIAPTGDDYDADFTKRMLARLEYTILRKAYATLRQQHPAVLGSHPIPNELSDIDPNDDAALRAAFYALSAIAVRCGTLHCSHCHAVYSVVDFIPVMLPEKK